MKLIMKNNKREWIRMNNRYEKKNMEEKIYLIKLGINFV